MEPCRHSTRCAVGARPGFRDNAALDIAEAAAVARANPAILAVVLVSIIMNMFAFSYSALIAPIGLDVYRVSPILVGALAAAEPLGAIAIGIPLSTGWLHLNGRRALLRGSLLFLMGLAAMALSPWCALAFVLLLIGGLGTAAFSNMQTTLILTEAPPATRSGGAPLVELGVNGLPVGRDAGIPDTSRRLTVYQVHGDDATTGHYLACDWRLTVYERILLARARELRYQSARKDVFARELGGLEGDIGNFGQWEWIIVREIDGNASRKASLQKTRERPKGVRRASQSLIGLLKCDPGCLDDLSKTEMKLVSQIVDKQGRAAYRYVVPVSSFRLSYPVRPCAVQPVRG
jgi:hypothetical protein